jgi:hypothetical protein
MLKILNEEYFLDLDKIENCVNIPKDTSKKSDDEDDSDESMQHISVVKYELIKMMIDVIMTESNEIDETLGTRSSEITIPFKLAFNTLINKQIITKY